MINIEWTAEQGHYRKTIEPQSTKVDNRTKVITGRHSCKLHIKLNKSLFVYIGLRPNGLSPIRLIMICCRIISNTYQSEDQTILGISNTCTLF